MDENEKYQNERIMKLEEQVLFLRESVFAMSDLLIQLSEIAEGKAGADLNRRFLFSKVSAMSNQVKRLNPPNIP